MRERCEEKILKGDKTAITPERKHRRDGGVSD